MTRLRLLITLLVVAYGLVVHAEAGFAGKWRGETGTGRAIALDLKVAGHTLTGTFTLATQTAEIKDGKISDNTATFTVALDGRTPAIKAELDGDRITLVVDGVSNPAIVTRVK